MYINSGAVYVHSATDMLTVRGNKYIVIHKGGEIASGVRGTTLPPASGLPRKKKI